jgi:hypothetical protein
MLVVDHAVGVAAAIGVAGLATPCASLPPLTLISMPSKRKDNARSCDPRGIFIEYPFVYERGDMTMHGDGSYGL